MSIELIEQFNQKQLERYSSRTGTAVNYPQALFDQQTFASKTPFSVKELRAGVLLTSSSLDLGDGSFCNSYDLSFAGEESLFTRIDSRPHPYYLRRSIINDPSIVATINGGFFFLADKSEFTPQEYPYNLCIRDKHVVGLPSVDMPVAFTKDGKIDVAELKAVGVLDINGESIDWRGVNSRAELSKDSAILYNSAASTIEHVPTEVTGKQRVLVSDANFTPTTKDGFDLVVDTGEAGLVVKDIRVGGNTNYFSGVFILQIQDVDPGRYKVGDLVRAENVYTLNLTTVDSAITIGPSVHHFLESTDHPINNDKSLGSNPPFINKPLARSVIYKSLDGTTHFQIFDGAPRTEYFKGITPIQLAQSIPHSSVEWVYSLDPGQSARLVTREPDQIGIYGNLHYLRWPKSKNTTFLWGAPSGRSVPSSISLCER